MINRKLLERIKWRVCGVIIIFILVGFRVIQWQANKYETMKSQIRIIEAKYNITLSDLAVVVRRLQSQDALLLDAQGKIEKLKQDNFDLMIVATSSQHWIEECYRKDVAYKTIEWRLYVWSLCKKYRYLCEMKTDEGYLEKWMFAVCSSETAFVPNAVYKRNADGFADYGIRSIHEPVNDNDRKNLAEMLEKVYAKVPELKGKDWKTSPSLNIALGYELINWKIKVGQNWSTMHEARGSDLLWKLKGIKP